MTHTRKLLVAFSFATMLPFAAANAGAQEPEPNTVPAGQAAKQRGPNDGYDVGLLGHFMTADPVLSVIYDRHQSVDGPSVGAFFTSRRPNGFRITVDAVYTTVSPKDGPWLGAGKDKSASEFTEFRQGGSRGFSIFSADLLLGHEFSSNGTFGFYIGGGIGLAAPMGKITGYDTTGPNFDQNAGTNPDNKLKSVPPIIPTVIFKLGPTVNFADKAVLSIDTGFEDGFFVGATVGYRL